MDTIKLIVKSIAPKVDVIYEDDSITCFDFDLNAVIIGKDLMLDDCGFIRHIIDRHKFVNAQQYSLIFWSILHELGHYFTGDDGIVSDEDAMQYTICAMIPREAVDENPNIQSFYFDIENEWNATEWAINWIQTHKLLAKLFNYIVK